MAAKGSGELTPSRIDALVRLLADDDEKIRRVAREHLAKAGQGAEEALRRSAAGAEDPRVRIAAQDFLRESRREEVLRLWSAFVRREDVDLEEGACLVARSEYPDFDPATARATLDEYADVLKKRIAALRSTEAVVDRINTLLFNELGFRGNQRDYYDPRNSYLNIVLERKLGIPISLSVVYLCVARRLSQKIEGVGMPGHFLLRYRSGKKTSFLDPFQKGRRWTHQDCEAYLKNEGYGFREEYLKPVGDRDILARVLANLLGVYHSREDTRRSDRVTRMFTEIQGV